MSDGRPGGRENIEGFIAAVRHVDEVPAVVDSHPRRLVIAAERGHPLTARGGGARRGGRRADSRAIGGREGRGQGGMHEKRLIELGYEGMVITAARIIGF